MHGGLPVKDLPLVVKLLDAQIAQENGHADLARLLLNRAFAWQHMGLTRKALKVRGKGD